MNTINTDVNKEALNVNHVIKKERYGVAMFGVGRIGQLHLKNLHDSGKVNILWLVDIEQCVQKMKELVTKYTLSDQTSVTTPDNLDQVFQDERVDVVFVCTPVPEHESLITKALSAGKHVFSEKPIALSSESSKRLYALAKSQNKVLFCAFNRRYDRQLYKMCQSIRHGEIGDVRMVKICSREPPTHSNPDYIKSSGGIFLDSMIHDFDMAYWLTGEIPESVVAMGHAHNSTYAQVGDVDSAAVMMKYKSGLVVILDNSRSAVYGYDQRVEVFGTKGMLLSNNPRQTYLEHWSEKATQYDPGYFAFIDRYSESYLQEIKHFINVLDGTDLYEDRQGTGATLAVYLAELCRKSNKTGQVVSLI